MRAERHANPDLARAARHGVSFHAVNAHDREKQRDPTERAEERCPEFDNPKPDALLNKIDKWRDAKNRKIGIDIAQSLPHRWNQTDNALSIFRIEAHVKIDVAGVTMSKRHEQSA